MLHVGRNSPVESDAGPRRAQLPPNHQPQLSAARVARPDAAADGPRRRSSCSPRPSTKRDELGTGDRTHAGAASAAAGNRSAAGRPSARSAAAGRQCQRHRLERYEVERYLRTEFQVEDEMADWFNVVYILSPHDDPAARRAVAGGVEVDQRVAQSRGRGRPDSRTNETARLMQPPIPPLGDAPARCGFGAKARDSLGRGGWPDVC